MATTIHSFISPPTFLNKKTKPHLQIPKEKMEMMKKKNGAKFKYWRVISMADQQRSVLGASQTYAYEMQRLSAKQALLLSFRDAGGFYALVTGKVTESQKVDVMERITVLERLNPTPRPTTSPYLEGRWNYEWFGSGSSAFSAARFLLEWFPSTLASLSKTEVLVKDSYTKLTVNFRLMNSVESKMILSSKLSVEGPLRMKEEYDEGLLESPNVIEEAVPQQLRSALAQAATTLQQLPLPIRDAFSSGIRIPLGGSFQRLFVISYLDDEIFIIRDSVGVPEVLTRLDVVTPPDDQSME